MEDQNRKVKFEIANAEKRFDSSVLGSQVVKYIVYAGVFFGLLYIIAAIF